MDQPTIKQAGIRDVTFGRDVTIISPCNLYGCELGDAVFVGPFVEIQRNVRVGHRSRIQSHSFICEKTVIGEDCFIGHGVMFVNDLMREGGPAYDPSKWQGAVLGNHVSVGSNATIMPVSICDNAVIGAGAVVTHPIEKPGIYAGVPARLLRSL